MLVLGVTLLVVGVETVGSAMMMVVEVVMTAAMW